VARPAPTAVPQLGRVASFDAARGLGTVEGDDGTTYSFHATAVADGTRRIDVDAPVTFTVARGHRGRCEARSLVSLPPSRPEA
jgi:cold shock CspA family protein